MVVTLDRPVFHLSRENEYFTEKELGIQFGYPKPAWPIVLVKELIDNSLDACERCKVSPRIGVELTRDSVSIQDNGDGLPEQALLGSLDYTIRASSNTFFVSPTRGQLGNALKLLWAAPFVATDGGWVDVETAQYGYRVVVRPGGLGQVSMVEAEPMESSVKFGTKVTIHWDEIASYLERRKSSGFYEPEFKAPSIGGLCQQYAMLNPHLAISFNGDQFTRPALVDQWKKWQPWMPTSIRWYNQDSFKNLVGGYLNKEDMPLRRFMANFDSLSGTQKQKAVMDRLGAIFPEAQRLSDLENLDALQSLLTIMQEESGEVKPSRLGAVGKDWLASQMKAMEGLTRYKKAEGVNRYNHPFVVEAAFGIYPDADFGRTVICGLNWSPTFKQPFDTLNSIFEDNQLEEEDPVWIVLNVTCVGFQFTDKGKGAITLDTALIAALKEVLDHVLKDWSKAKKKQKRDDERASSKAQAEARKALKKIDIKTFAWNVMERAYLEASDNGSLPTTARQIMYKARPMILELTGGEFYKNSDSFTQRDLPDFMAAHPELTQGWDVLYDPRGNFLEPHSSNPVPLGTKQVREYLSRLDPRNSYQYVLFIEKEGFGTLFQQFRLQEKWDIALMSTKGMSNTASRQLVEGLSNKGVTILVAHDFDRSGFSILGTLKGNTRRYQYQTKPRVIDIGLRLSDIEAMDLDYEVQPYNNLKADPRDKLREYGATDAELEWLCQQDEHGDWYGHRVELNAMDSRQLLDWLERNFEEAGVSKVIPDESTLEAQYIQAFERTISNRVMEAIMSHFRGPSAASPGGLAEKVSGIFSDNRHLSWADAVDRLVSRDCDTEIPNSLEQLIERFFSA